MAYNKQRKGRDPAATHGFDNSSPYMLEKAQAKAHRLYT